MDAGEDRQKDKWLAIMLSFNESVNGRLRGHLSVSQSLTRLWRENTSDMVLCAHCYAENAFAGGSLATLAWLQRERGATWVWCKARLGGTLCPPCAAEERHCLSGIARVERFRAARRRVWSTCAAASGAHPRRLDRLGRPRLPPRLLSLLPDGGDITTVRQLSFPHLYFAFFV